MTSPDKPPFMPFTDEEGYYVRDPKAVLNRTDEGFLAFSAHLLALAEGIDKANAALFPEQQALAQKLRAELQAVQADTKVLLALLRELATYNIELTKQRQSARAAYQKGWDERGKDILSQLHPVDQRMLRWIIKHLDAEDQDQLAF